MTMFSFFKRSKPARAVIDGATVHVLLDNALRGRKAPNYRHLAQKQRMAVIGYAEIEKASAKSFAPWVEGRWECEDIARSLIDTAQRTAANEGLSWAVGTLRAQKSLDELHVYAWAIVHREGRFADRDVVFYDPTARKWVGADELKNVDYTLT